MGRRGIREAWYEKRRGVREGVAAAVAPDFQISLAIVTNSIVHRVHTLLHTSKKTSTSNSCLVYTTVLLAS